MKNDESDFCNFEFYEVSCYYNKLQFVDSFIYLGFLYPQILYMIP